MFDLSEFSRKKNWGFTTRLEGLNPYDTHIAYIDKEKESSVHKHNNLYNFIMCLWGKVSIIYPKNLYNPIKSYSNELKPYDAVEIAPNIVHKFVAKENSIILESYYEIPPKSFLALSYFDIEREK